MNIWKINLNFFNQLLVIYLINLVGIDLFVKKQL